MRIVHDKIAVIEDDQWIAQWIQDAGRLDHDIGIRRDICPLIPGGGVVIDGGANIGTHTVPYAECVGRDGTVFAFEPNPAAFECLKYNCAPFPQVCLSRFALANFNGPIELRIDKTNPGASHIVENAPDSWPAGAVTIDSLQLDRCNFIKLDLEGYELKALMGALDTIHRCLPVMVIEVSRGHLARAAHHTPEELYTWLRDMQYSIHEFNGNPRNEQYDILCKPL